MDIDKLQKYRLVYHLLFWITFVLVFSLFFTIQFPFTKSFTIISLTALSYMPAVYFNVSYLIPKVLVKNRQFYPYVLYVLITVLVSVPLVGLVSYYNFKESENFTDNYSLVSLVVGSFINIFFMVVLVSGLKFAKDYFIQQQKTMELQQTNLQSELKFLKSQINPHFLFNTLNNIYALTLKKDTASPEAVLKLAELMRYILYDCNEKQVPLQKEILCIKNYIDLERLRQEEGSKIQVKFSGDPDHYTIAPLLFLPFLENSFKHGLHGSIKSNWVEINLQVSNDYLNFKITNSKSPNQLKDQKNSGIGLRNVKRRLDLLYPESHYLEITDGETEYKVDLTVQLKHKKIETEVEDAGPIVGATPKVALKIN